MYGVTISSHPIGQELEKIQNIFAVVFGNAYFTFVAFGGKSKQEYDWYFKVNIDDIIKIFIVI